MLLCSYVLWKRFNNLLTPPSSTRARDCVRSATLVFFFFAHSAWVYFYISVSDHSWITLFSFICVAIYIHLTVFVVAAICLEKGAELVFPDWHHPIVKSEPFHTLLALVLALMLTLSGLSVTKKIPTIHSVDVLIDDLPLEFSGFSIALLTDIHVGPTVGMGRVDKIVSITNSLKPHAVMIVGDLVDGFREHIGHHVLPLSRLKSKYGTFFVTGNHEYYHGDVNQWIDFFRAKTNMTILRNEARVLGGDLPRPLCFTGVDDIYTEKLRIVGHKMDASKALSQCPDNSVNILLVHQPNAAEKIINLVQKPIHLALSGHTHGGQMYVFWPFAYLKNAYLHGLYTEENTGTQIYVSSGVNYWGPPVKMPDLCEIAFIRLHPKSTS
ncbi:hypothetical protein L596_007843 [Steinernema carpocapsae]|nr:hypothetical protein L596_007843 [Steinernema carpocapsae]